MEEMLNLGGEDDPSKRTSPPQFEMTIEPRASPIQRTPPVTNSPSPTSPVTSPPTSPRIGKRREKLDLAREVESPPDYASTFDSAPSKSSPGVIATSKRSRHYILFSGLFLYSSSSLIFILARAFPPDAIRIQSAARKSSHPFPVSLASCRTRSGRVNRRLTCRTKSTRIVPSRTRQTPRQWRRCDGMVSVCYADHVLL